MTKSQLLGQYGGRGGACSALQSAYAPLAQLVEQLTLNQWVPGSNP